jgi:hypothetical protein
MATAESVMVQVWSSDWPALPAAVLAAVAAAEAKSFQPD